MERELKSELISKRIKEVRKAVAALVKERYGEVVTPMEDKEGGLTGSFSFLGGEDGIGVYVTYLAWGKTADIYARIQWPGKDVIVRSSSGQLDPEKVAEAVSSRYEYSKRKLSELVDRHAELRETKIALVRAGVDVRYDVVDLPGGRLLICEDGRMDISVRYGSDKMDLVLKLIRAIKEG